MAGLARVAEAAQSMDITFEHPSAGCAVVVLAGRLDLLSAPDVKRQLVQTVERGAPRLVVDLDAVSFIDSSGLGALIAGLRATRQAGGDLRIARPAEQARVILELTNLDRVLTCYGTTEAALDGFGV
jgi:anti-sigma B factor antagonist